VDGVKRNVARYGRVEACEFVKGVLCRDTGHLSTESIVLVFEDADLVSSVEDCLRHVWPMLQPGSRFYCHEPWSIDVVALFYDKTWWKREFGLQPPGFFGSGGGTRSSPEMGYALKLDPSRVRSA
jgi:O-methyltransferase